MRLTRSTLFGLTAALALVLAGCPEDEPTTEEACSPACSGTTPICDEATKTCKTCTATEGCSGGQVCDLSVAKGECVECTSDTHCDQAAPICDTAVNECVVCTALVGCGNGQTCDTSVAGGRCVSAGCTASSQCSGATPVCNTSTGVCVVCTATEGCDEGESCVDNACVEDTECTASSQCAEPTPVCDTVAGTCVVCTATEGCEADETCTAGACVPDGCSGDSDCSGATPKCNTTTHACVECLGEGDCDATENCTANVCVPAGCSGDGDCSGATPKCNTTTHACVECLGEGDCDANENCTANVCVPEAADPSAQIAAVRAAATTAGTTEATGLTLPIQGAFVSYVKAANAAYGSSDPAGFVLQAVNAGPAIFVAVDPATTTPALVAGDKVNLTVTAVKTTSSGALLYATAIDGLTRISQGNALTGLVQDVSGVDLVTTLADYDYELVSANATIAGDFSGGGTGHVKAQITTTGVATATSKVVVRLPTTLKDSLGLSAGCSLTVNGFMWHYGDTAQVSAYSASEVSNVTCPAPTVVSAAASDANTVVVTFDLDLAASSVLANGSQFTIAPSLAVSAASVAGKVVTLTTAAQTANTSYTVTVANTVTSAAGTALGSTNSATFTGYEAGAAINVFFSEYVEGTSNNKAIEIFNAGGAISDLSVCTIKVYSAGGATATGTFPLPAQALAAGATLVICNNSAGTALKAQCDAVGALYNSTATNYNGDDALELSCNSVVFDAIGQIGGGDPGTNWTANGVATSEQTLRRKCGLTAGDAVGSDAFDPSVQWDSSAQDTFDGLGAHSTVCP